MADWRCLRGRGKKHKGAPSVWGGAPVSRKSWCISPWATFYRNSSTTGASKKAFSQTCLALCGVQLHCNESKDYFLDVPIKWKEKQSVFPKGQNDLKCLYLTGSGFDSILREVLKTKTELTKETWVLKHLNLKKLYWDGNKYLYLKRNHISFGFWRNSMTIFRFFFRLSFFSDGSFFYDVSICSLVFSFKYLQVTSVFWHGEEESDGRGNYR